MSAYKFVSRPFKGNVAYEVQVGPFVLQWRHDGRKWSHSSSIARRIIRCGPALVWWDTAWWHEATYPIRRFRRY